MTNEISSNNQIKPLQQSFDELSLDIQKQVQSFELNLNEQNYLDNNINNSNFNNISNIVNIDNQGSAIELCFIAKKPKKKYKITTLFQAGNNQSALYFSIIAEKPNKSQNINCNELNTQNLSFISSKKIDSNYENNHKQEVFFGAPKQK